MAAELRVKLCRSIEIDRLILAAEMVLQELLALSYVPTLGIEEVEGGVCYPTTSGSIGKKDQMFVVRFRGYDEAVAIVVYEISLHLSVPESEVGFWASVSVGAMRTPLEYVLAAGVAVALARVAEADVIDDSLLWSQIIERAPEDFIKGVRVDKDSGDICSAAEAIYAAMPAGKYDVEKG